MRFGSVRVFPVGAVIRARPVLPLVQVAEEPVFPTRHEELGELGPSDAGVFHDAESTSWLLRSLRRLGLFIVGRFLVSTKSKAGRSSSS